MHVKSLEISLNTMNMMFCRVLKTCISYR